MGHLKEIPNELSDFPRGAIVVFKSPHGRHMETGGEIFSSTFCREYEKWLDTWPGFHKAVVVGSDRDPVDSPIVYVDLLFEDRSRFLDTNRTGMCQWFRPEEFMPRTTPRKKTK